MTVENTRPANALFQVQTHVGNPRLRQHTSVHILDKESFKYEPKHILLNVSSMNRKSPSMITAKQSASVLYLLLTANMMSKVLTHQGNPPWWLFL